MKTCIFAMVGVFAVLLTGCAGTVEREDARELGSSASALTVPTEERVTLRKAIVPAVERAPEQDAASNAPAAPATTFITTPTDCGHPVESDCESKPELVTYCSDYFSWATSAASGATCSLACHSNLSCVGVSGPDGVVWCCEEVKKAPQNTYDCAPKPALLPYCAGANTESPATYALDYDACPRTHVSDACVVVSDVNVGVMWCCP